MSTCLLNPFKGCAPFIRTTSARGDASGRGDPSRVTGSSSSADMKSLPAPLIALAIEAFRLWSMSATRATPQCPDQHLPRGP